MSKQCGTKSNATKTTSKLNCLGTVKTLQYKEVHNQWIWLCEVQQTVEAMYPES